MRRLKRLWLALLLTGAAAAQTITLAPSNPGSAGAVGNILSVTSVTNGIITIAPSGVTLTSGVLTFNNGQMNLLNALSGTTLGYELNGGVVVGDATSNGNLLTDSLTNDIVLTNGSGSNRILLGILANHSAMQVTSAKVGFSLPVGLALFTVSTLPSATTAGAGAQVIVSDASTFTVGTCTGGGSDYMIAVSNGSTWSCH